jgi:hypothetical protein
MGRVWAVPYLCKLYRDICLTTEEKARKNLTHFHLVPKLRMGGATPLRPLYAFIAWTETTLLLDLSHSVRIVDVTHVGQFL